MKEYIVQAFDFQETIDLDPFRAEDVPELIRCRDCKWFLSDNICGNKRLSDQEDIATLGPDWFCADGRRRDE